MALSNPTVDDFKTAFARAFPFNADPALGITDTDISNAFVQTNGTINQCLFPSQDRYSPAYLNLSAHFLTLTLRAMSGGINGGGGGFLEQSKSVGSVSQGFMIPQQIQNNMLYAAYMTTPWGALYLNALLPYLVAPIFIAPGRTLP